MQALWGLDLGGTKIEGVVFKSINDLTPIARLRVPTEQAQGYDHILQQIKKLVDQLSAVTYLSPTRIGIGTPGTLDPQTQLLKNSNTLCLNNQPLKKDLEAILGVPLEMANDANCFAMAEARMGAVQTHFPEARVVFGVILGTGVGGGVVVDGRIIGGRQGIGGEWGHNPLNDSGGPCYCGKVGCVEKVISGPSLEAYYAQHTGEKRSMKEILARREEDPFAAETIARLIHFFGKGIAQVINILDPDVIVLGGGVGNIELLYTEGVAAVLPYVFNNRLDTIFLKPELGDSAGVYGAALLTANQG
ncbi:MAG: ROK family protein [Saprospiraceae bacterium]|nr:ROK family protein [Saprospiraceae bacterium]MDZ4703833.1 ROK family protein [Saprospiraceae bacterium]